MKEIREERKQRYCDLSNIWAGVSVSTQKDADEMIPVLLDIPAAVHFVSYEPALEGIDLCRPYGQGVGELLIDYLDWVICGTEPGTNRRPFNIKWAINLKNQCVEAGVPFFMKQIQDKNGKVIKDIEKFPEELRIREMPDIKGNK